MANSDNGVPKGPELKLLFLIPKGGIRRNELIDLAHKKKMGHTTFYRATTALIRGGLIERVREKGKLPVFYHLTPMGEELLRPLKAYRSMKKQVMEED